MKTLTLSAELGKLKLDLANERLGLPSASAASRLANCPGSWRMEMNMPELTKYADSADSGTRIHNFLAGNHGETLDESERKTAESLAQGGARLRAAWAESIGVMEYQDESLEERWFLHAGIVPVTSGKWDVLVRSGQHYLLCDWKTGWQDLPPVRSNLQLRIYALLVWQKFPDAESISVAIVRPGDEENDKAHFYTYTPVELESAWLWWAKVLDSVFSDRPPIVSGEHCQFCKAQHVCPARVSALSIFHASAEAVDLPSWGALQPDQKLDLFKRWKEAERFGKAVAERVKQDLEAGVSIPGLAIGKGRTTHEIDDAQAAYTRALAEGMTHAEFMECITASFAQLRDKLQACKGWKKKDATENAKGVLSGIVTTHTTKGSVEIA